MGCGVRKPREVITLGPTVKLSTKIKSEARVALIKRSERSNIILVFVLRGVKGLEKAYVVESEEQVAEILRRFPATAVEVEQVRAGQVGPLPKEFESIVAAYADLLERLSSELASLAE